MAGVHWGVRGLAKIGLRCLQLGSSPGPGTSGREPCFCVEWSESLKVAIGLRDLPCPVLAMVVDPLSLWRFAVGRAITGLPRVADVVPVTKLCPPCVLGRGPEKRVWGESWTPCADAGSVDMEQSLVRWRGWWPGNQAGLSVPHGLPPPALELVFCWG